MTMDDFFAEPWALFVVFAVIANFLWLLLWSSMAVGGRFKNAFGKGVPILMAVGLFNVPFGVLFTFFLILGSLLFSVFWLYASATDSYAKELRAVRRFFNPKAFEEEGGEGEIADENEETKS
jgi:hypothetical protein